MIFISLIPGLFIYRFNISYYSTENFFNLFFIFIYIPLLVFYTYSFWGLLHFAGFSDLYDQRANYNIYGAGAFYNYLTGWLSNALNPYLVAYGLFEKKKRWAIPIGILGQIIVYMAFAGKMMLTIIFVQIFFYIIYIFYKKTCHFQ